MARADKTADRPAPLHIGDIEFDRGAGVVRRFGRERTLGPVEFRILELLMSHPDRVFSRTDLIAAAWDDTHGIEERTVDVKIGRLRKRINRPGSPDPIRSVRALGYKFATALASEPDATARKVKLRPVRPGQERLLGRASSREPLFLTGLLRTTRR
jgi:two-component system phosphate regulon response regulator PhoB